MTAKATRPLKELASAAEKINAFAERLTIASHPIAYASGTAAVLAEVNACVCDDEGGPLDPSSNPVGSPRLVVDIEFFRENCRQYTAGGRAEIAAANAAEDEIVAFCKGLGFDVEHESSVGSGQYGTINQLRLS